MSNGMTTVSECWLLESKTDSCQTRPSSVISKHSTVMGTPQHIRDWLMSLPEDSRVSPSRSQAGEPEPTTAATCGQQLSNASAWYDRDTRSWRTFQDSLLPGISAQSWETWPKAGMTVAGVFYRRPKWERRISAIGSGLWPTPRASLGMSVRLTQYGADHATERNGNLEDKILEYYPLEAIGKYINQEFVEKMMGFPIGWTALEPLATDRFRQWCEQHGNC